MYPGSALGVDDILGLEHRHVVIATGARWTKMLFSTWSFRSVNSTDRRLIRPMTSPPRRAAGARRRIPISTTTTWRRHRPAIGGLGGRCGLCDDGGQRVGLDIHDQRTAAGSPRSWQGRRADSHAAAGDRPSTAKLRRWRTSTAGPRSAWRAGRWSSLAPGHRGTTCIRRSSQRDRILRTPASIRSRASAMRSHRERSCTRFTAATATRASSIRRPRPRLHRDFRMNTTRWNPLCLSGIAARRYSERKGAHILPRMDRVAASGMPNPGDHLVLDVFGESILLVRNREGHLRPFTMCAGIAGRACAEARQRRKRCVCPARRHHRRTHDRLPYHQWSYDFNGALIAAPHLSAGRRFKKQDFHLYPGRRRWGGFVIPELDPAEPNPSPPSLNGIPSELQRYPLSDLGIGATIRYELRQIGKSSVRITTSATMRRSSPGAVRVVPLP